MDLPTGILSKHITRKGDLCIRNLHQTFLRSEVTFGERSGCLISAICHLGTICAAVMIRAAYAPSFS